MSDKDETKVEELEPEVKAEQETAEDVAAEPVEGDVVDAEEQRDEEMEALQNAVATAKEDVIRAQAEMANVRRRAEKDVENARRYSGEKFAKDILPVVDNLERALAAAEDKNSVTEGVELTLKSLISTLEKHHITPIEPAGEPFDPDLHEAISMVPNPDMEPNTVMDVVQKGYKLYDRVIRAAMVVVSQ